MSDDEEYWNNKARNLRYHQQVRSSMIDGTEIIEPVAATSEELSAASLRRIGPVSFEAELDRLQVPRFFHSLDDATVKVAVGIGILGGLTAALWDSGAGKWVEGKLWPDLDKNHPADALGGANHRYYFGHDLLNPNQRLPPGYLWNGEDIGGTTLSELIERSYGLDSPSSVLINLRNTLQYLYGTHFLRDFVTPAGLPLPGSSYFTEWSESQINACGYQRSNQLMDALGREYGSITGSDVASIGLMKLLTAGYLKNRLTNHSVSATADRLLTAQVTALTYGTCLGAQLLWLAITGPFNPERKKIIPGAKLNLILLGLFARSSYQVMSIVAAEHREIISHYEESIRTLGDPSLTFEDWLKAA